MALPEWTNEDGIPYQFTEIPTRQYKGVRLAGTILSAAVAAKVEIAVQEWERSGYHLAFRLLRFLHQFKVKVKDRKCIRLEAVLTGDLHVSNAQGQSTKVMAGQYHITDVASYQVKEGEGCSYFVTYYPDDLIHNFGVDISVISSRPQQMPASMVDLIQEALHHPYDEKLQSFYYQHIVRDLLFIHLTHTHTKIPGELSATDIAAVYQADAILATDLSEHYSIRELSGKVGTNAFKLKKGFRLIFNMGVFGRLIYRRMEQAKLLLASTSKPIKEVALEAGYETVAGFITAFRKRFGMTPLEWRERKGMGKH